MKPFVLLNLFTLLSGSAVLAQSPQPRIKVYLLGVFHFAQTDSTYDVLEPHHQQDISKVCEKIKALAPDKIFIERQPDFEYESKMDSLYQAFRGGDPRVRRNEIWQVAFRVARDLGHDSVYSCDHPGQYGFFYGQIADYAGAHGQMDVLEYKAPGTTRPPSDFMNEDSLMQQVSLLDYLRWLNAPEIQAASHAHYVNVYPQTGNVNVFNYNEEFLLGAQLTADWYRRNIMIYTKMINQLDYSEKAIFLVMGNDHIPIIRHLFESNPYFEVVDTPSWLGKNRIRMNRTK